MPLFAIICRDKAGALQTRKDTREAHLAFLRQDSVVHLAGPLIENGDPCGSLIVVEADSMDHAQTWAAQDPYKAAGLFDSVEIIEWVRVIG
ncbi:YciI family protein [Paracoccus sp. TK19116]|uniref:YciI family protein n=1 Tax=Paracoccus albicereus TaxID=2922394 RepID=A0ABT1MSS2_9RHOB|nr:YciI family protein [Paracoccus albicereus]MCQ0971348.1 YciI family protein [Paracoccus albicereus]